MHIGNSRLWTPPCPLRLPQITRSPLCERASTTYECRQMHFVCHQPHFLTGLHAFNLWANSCGEDLNYLHVSPRPRRFHWWWDRADRSLDGKRGVSRAMCYEECLMCLCMGHMCVQNSNATRHIAMCIRYRIYGEHTIEPSKAVRPYHLPLYIYIYICGWSQVRIPRAEYHRKRKGVPALRVMCRFYRFIDYISIIILWHRSMKSRHYRRCASRAQAVYVVSKYQQIAFWFYEINNFAEFITQATGRFK